jgi:simple sugar transport system permease protein
MIGLIVAYEANVVFAPVSILLGFLGAFLGGGLWAAVSGFLKVKYRVDDIVSTFMLSLVAGLLVDYLVRVPFASPNHAMSALASVELPESAVFPSIGGLNGVFIFSLILAAFMYIVMTRTKIGFRINVMGSNMDTAIAYFGKSYTNRLFILSTFISGGIVGVGGMTILSAFTRDILAGASSGAYTAGSFTNSYGFIAWAIVFLAGFNAIAIIPASIFFVMLVIGGLGLLVINGIPSSLTLTITGITILFVAARIPIINQFNKLRRKRVAV